MAALLHLCFFYPFSFCFKKGKVILTLNHPFSHTPDQRLAQHARSLRQTPPTSSSSPSPSLAPTSKSSILNSTTTDGSTTSDPILIQQLSSAKEELSSLYKTQGQNAQRLLDLTDQLRDRDERNRLLEEELRTMREETNKFDRKKEEWEGRLEERLTAVQVSSPFISKFLPS